MVANQDILPNVIFNWTSGEMNANCCMMATGKLLKSSQFSQWKVQSGFCFKVMHNQWKKMEEVFLPPRLNGTLRAACHLGN